MDGDWERTAEAFKGGTMSQRQRDKRQANLKPLQTSGHGNKEERSREEKKDQENGISGKLSSFPGVFLLLWFHLKQALAHSCYGDPFSGRSE